MMDTDRITAERDATFRRLDETEELVGDPDGTLTVQGERFNIMGSDYFMADIFKMLKDLYGQGSGGILRQTGISYGTDLTEFIEQGDGIETDIGRLLGLLAFLGYSKGRVEDEDIIVPSSPTAEEYRRADHGEDRTCYFLAGILTGALQDLGHAITVTETACRAAGDDVCRFELEQGA